MGALPSVRTTSVCRAVRLTITSRYGAHRACTAAEWTSILSLATRWDFTDIRTLAIREIQSLDISPIDKIVLAQEFDISGRWLLAAYTALCERAEPLSISEGTRLGLETAMRVAQLRADQAPLYGCAYRFAGAGALMSLRPTAIVGSQCVTAPPRGARGAPGTATSARRP